MLDYIFFNNKMTTDFGTFITNAGAYQSPSRVYEKVSVPGKNGDILFEQNMFENIDQVYPAIIHQNFDANFSALKAFLLSSKGYKKLSDTYHPEEYYLATFKEITDIKVPEDHQMGSFRMVFDRKPQKFLVSGDKKLTFNTFPATLFNPTMFKAYPLIRLYGSGTLTIGNKSLALNTQSEYVDIDCELQEALQPGENINITLANGEFPYLTKGENTITWTGSEIEITPRWYNI